jgi:hypothetical protein
MTNTVTVSARAAIKGESLAGVYPVVQTVEDGVIIRHPKHGPVRIRNAQINAAPATAPVAMSYDDLLKDIQRRFHTLNRVMHGIVEGRIRSAIVSGAAGVGKTHTVNAILAAAKANKKIKEYIVIRGTISPIGLYKLLWENRREGHVIVLDDSDSIFFDEVGASLIKAATDSGKKRTVSYVKETSILENNGIPQTFNYAGGIVVATNINFEREVAMQSKIAVHLGAVLNRALYIDLGLHSKQALMARVEDVCRNTSMLKDEGLDKPQVEAVIQWIKDNQNSVRSLSLRTAVTLAGLVLADPDEWRELARNTLLQATKR